MSMPNTILLTTTFARRSRMSRGVLLFLIEIACAIPVRASPWALEYVAAAFMRGHAHENNAFDHIARCPSGLQTATPAAQAILRQTEREDALVLTRNLELGDLMFGYEQARQLLLKDAHGRSLLALAEQPGNLLAGVLLRQIFDSSRAFTIDVFDVPHLLEQGAPPERPMFRIKRDFPWFNVMAWLRRDIFVHDEEDRIVAAVTRVWHPFHRTYELYHVAPQHDEDEDAPLTLFGQVSTPFWSALFTWRYPVLDAYGNEVTCVHRIFGSGVQGFATQIFTEVGNYYMPFDKQHLALRQRLATVACAVSVDYDYYSHRAGGGGWLWPIAIFGGGNDD